MATTADTVSASQSETPVDDGNFDFGNFEDATIEETAETKAASVESQEKPYELEKPKEEESEKTVVSDEKIEKEKSDDKDDSREQTDLRPTSDEVAKEEDEASSSSKVEAEVCEAFFEWINAWNSGNLFGYLDAYWESDQTRYISEHLADGPHSKGGVIITGRREIDKIFTDIFIKNKKFQEKYKVKKGVAGIITLRKLIVTPTGGNHDHAIVFGEEQLELAGDKKGTIRGSVWTIHVQKINGWKIISEHATALPKK